MGNVLGMSGQEEMTPSLMLINKRMEIHCSMSKFFVCFIEFRTKKIEPREDK